MHPETVVFDKINEGINMIRIKHRELDIPK